ncbi:hypothetical protein [Foliimonas ilicis]
MQGELFGAQLKPEMIRTLSAAIAYLDSLNPELWRAVDVAWRKAMRLRRSRVSLFQALTQARPTHWRIAAPISSFVTLSDAITKARP